VFYEIPTMSILPVRIIALPCTADLCSRVVPACTAIITTIITTIVMAIITTIPFE